MSSVRLTALHSSFKLIMNRLVTLLLDIEGMVRISKKYTLGKLENGFAISSSKRIVAIETDLRNIFSAGDFNSAEEFMNSSFTPVMKPFLMAVKNAAMVGDFETIESRVNEMRRLSASLVQIMRGNMVDGSTFSPRPPPDLPQKKLDVTKMRSEETLSSGDSFIRNEFAPRSVSNPNMSSIISSTNIKHSTQNDQIIRTSSQIPTKKLTLSKLQYDRIEQNKSNSDIQSLPHSLYLSKGFKEVNPSTRSGGNVLPGQWQCHLCTVVNSERDTVCTICDSPRMDTKHTKSFKEKTKGWVCTKCTVENDIKSTTCSMCGESKIILKWCCPSCKVWNPNEERKCTMCGEKNNSTQNTVNKTNRHTQVIPSSPKW